MKDAKELDFCFRGGTFKAKFVSLYLQTLLEKDLPFSSNAGRRQENIAWGKSRRLGTRPPSLRMGQLGSPEHTAGPLSHTSPL